MLLLRIKYWTLWYTEYGSPFCAIIHRSYKLSNMVGFLWLKVFGIFSVRDRFPEFTQRIFKYDDIQNNFAPDKEPNILVYWTPSYVIICRSYILSKIVQFFCPTLCNILRTHSESITMVNWVKGLRGTNIIPVPSLQNLEGLVLMPRRLHTWIWFTSWDNVSVT